MFKSLLLWSFLLVLIFLIPAFCQTSRIKFFNNTTDSNKTLSLPSPVFYTNSDFLVGAEITDPAHPSGFFTRATQLWKTDIRIGAAFSLNDDIKTFFAIRDQDSPETNDLKLYEAGVKINHGWGTIMFGQKRIQSGNQSFYLNNAFDRSFWDRGLIYDFLFRGVDAGINLMDKNELEIFLGSDLTASFVGGINYNIEPLRGWRTRISGLYVARDPQYNGFGWQTGIESKETFENFFGYQVISYNILDQDPKPIKELTLFAEGRLKTFGRLEFGAASLFRRLMDFGPNRDEFRSSIDMSYEINELVSPGIQAEVFELADYKETHLGVFVYLNYLEGIRIVPRIRYIFTEIGPDILFFGLEGKIVFGKWE